jgi:hypothetical protein
MTGDPEQEYFVDGMVEEIMPIGSRRQKHPKTPYFLPLSEGWGVR